MPITCEQLFVGIDKKKSSGEDIECQVCLLGVWLVCHSEGGDCVSCCVIVRVGIECHTVLLCAGHVQYVGDLQ